MEARIQALNGLAEECADAAETKKIMYKLRLNHGRDPTASNRVWNSKRSKSHKSSVVDAWRPGIIDRNLSAGQRALMAMLAGRSLLTAHFSAVKTESMLSAMSRAHPHDKENPAPP